jgi:hypothetical protein
MLDISNRITIPAAEIKMTAVRAQIKKLRGRIRTRDL